MTNPPQNNGRVKIFLMMVISWNVGGLRDWQKRSLIKTFLFKFNLHWSFFKRLNLTTLIYGLLNLYGGGAREILVGLAWTHLKHLIMWNDPAISISDATKGQYSLSLLITLANGFKILGISYLCPFSHKDRPLMWQELYDLSCLCEEHWLLVEDSNLTRWARRKISERITHNMKLFNRFISDVGPIDLPLQKSLYSWSNNKSPLWWHWLIDFWPRMESLRSLQQLELRWWIGLPRITSPSCCPRVYQIGV